MSEVLVQLPTHADFAAAANSGFVATFGDGSQTGLSLVNVSSLNENGVTRSFSLMFRAPGEVSAEQNTYRLSHPELGEMDIFLVPVKRDAEGLYFESVFNQLVAKSV